MSAQPTQYLTYKLGDEMFAVGVSQVREILEMAPITKVPTAPDYMRGVVNVRGNAIPVVDLRLKFGLPRDEDTLHTRIIVLELKLDGESCVIGGIADSVHEVIELDPSQTTPPPTIAMRWRSDFIRGMGRRGEEFIIILDIDAVFTAGDLALVGAQPATAA